MHTSLERANARWQLSDNAVNLTDPSGMLAAYGGFDFSGRGLTRGTYGPKPAGAARDTIQQRDARWTAGEFLWSELNVSGHDGNRAFAGLSPIAAPHVLASPLEADGPITIPGPRVTYEGSGDVLDALLTTAGERVDRFATWESSKRAPRALKDSIDGMLITSYVAAGRALGFVSDKQFRQNSRVDRFLQSQAQMGYTPGEVVARPAIFTYNALRTGDVNAIADVADATAKLSFGTAAAAMAVPVMGRVLRVPAAGTRVSASRTALSIAARQQMVAARTAEHVALRGKTAALLREALAGRRAAVGMTRAQRDALRKLGADLGWAEEELMMVRLTGGGTRGWTHLEISELLENGTVAGYSPHHINSVVPYEWMAGKANNIRIVRRWAEHAQWHGGNTQLPTQGELINRSRLINEALRRR